MTRSIGAHIASFLLFTIIQVVLFLNFNMYEYGFAFVYIGFLIFLPMEVTVIPAMIIAFIQGMTIDLFYNTLGTHMFAATLLAYCRVPLINMLAPRLIDTNTDLQNISQLGFQRVVVLTFILCFIHHAALLFLINPGGNFFFSNVVKVILSTCISGCIILSFKRLFFNAL